MQTLKNMLPFSLRFYQVVRELVSKCKQDLDQTPSKSNHITRTTAPWPFTENICLHNVYDQEFVYNWI